MRNLAYFLVVFIVSLPACRKSSTANPAGRWHLVEKKWSLGNSGGVRVPAADSSVTLVLNANKTYRTELNGKTVSASTYTIINDTAWNNQPFLALNDFKTTGIFASFSTFQVDANGQVVTTSEGLYLNVTDGILTLSSPINPGAFTSYRFEK